MTDIPDIVPTPETWEQYLKVHTFTDNPYHNLRVLQSRMLTVQGMNGAPDRTEYGRLIEAFEEVITELEIKTKLKKRFRNV